VRLRASETSQLSTVSVATQYARNSYFSLLTSYFSLLTSSLSAALPNTSSSARTRLCEPLPTCCCASASGVQPTRPCRSTTPFALAFRTNLERPLEWQIPPAAIPRGGLWRQVGPTAATHHVSNRPHILPKPMGWPHRPILGPHNPKRALRRSKADEWAHFARKSRSERTSWSRFVLSKWLVAGARGGRRFAPRLLNDLDAGACANT
jgi:hypothetical protein